jgi:hypothetical protein
METTEEPDHKESPPSNADDQESVSSTGCSTPKSQNATQNPDLPADIDVEEIMTKIRGDRIGESMFSERFLLQTLIKLTTIEKKLSEDEEFEKDLCTLWDMVS